MQLQLQPSLTRRAVRVGINTTPRIASRNTSRVVVKATFTQYGTKSAVNGQRLTKDALVKDPDLAEVR